MTLHDQLDARIRQFGDVPWTSEMSLREWETARADRFGSGLFYLLGTLHAMTRPGRKSPTKTEILTAIADALDNAERESGVPSPV